MVVLAWQRSKDRWRGFIMGIRKSQIDNFSDHSIVRYIATIKIGLDDERLGKMDKKSVRAVGKAVSTEMS